MPLIRQIINIGALLSLLASLLGIGGEAPANRPNLQRLLAPDSSVVASVPASSVDESAVPHYFGPWPNWANSPFTLPDAVVTITGDGAGATAEASVGLNGMITGITITNPGSGYSSATVTITGSGSGATADAVVTTTGIVTGITVTAGGAGYTAPTVTISGGGATTDATATAYGGIGTLTLTSPGSGYTFPTVDFDYPDDPNGTMPKAHVDWDPATGAITAIYIDNPGSGYLTPPNVVIRDGTQADPINNRAVRASAVRTQAIQAEQEGALAGVASGFTTLETATATATATLAVQYVVMDTFGAGYTSAPTVTINDPTGAGAIATATVDAGGVTAINLTNAGSGYITGNGMKKFVDPLPGLCDPANGGCPTVAQLQADPLAKALPLGVPEVKTYNGIEADEYEIALVQFRMSFSSSLPPTTLVRAYVQVETPAIAGISQHVPLVNEMLDGSTQPVLINGVQAYGITPPQYLGPVIVTPKNRPVRIVFHNMLPTGVDGDLFLPVDTSLMGSGMAGGNDPFDPIPVPGGTVTDDVRNPPCTTARDGTAGAIECYTKNRATLHLHGGNTPWISDGTPHQWISPAGENTAYPQGVSVGNVPDMNVCQAGDDGCQTFYYTNQQSARLMFYHDHAYGLTRLNVYAGEAAGYLITDDTEAKLIGPGGALEGLGVGMPLIVQDKTFVPEPEQLDWQDPTWDTARWGGYGNLWYHHVYMPAQNPGDPGGMSAFGRWMYGPWFWPPANEAKFGPIANPYYNMDPEGPNGIRGDADDWTTPLAVPCSFDDPSTWQYQEDPFCEPQLIPGTPNISAGMEQFNDTPLVNGTAYPTLTVEPKAYRFRVLNAANDRFFNFQWYVGDPSTASTDTNYKGEVIGPTEVAFDETLLALAQTDGTVFPTPDMSDDGGTDPSFSAPGPDWIVIGSEGGFLPAPVLRDGQQFTTWVTDPTVFHVGTVDLFSLLLAPAERADVVVDFSQFAGQTLILYNDAPAAFPARITSYDYFTGAPDMRPVGAPPILPGYGPNTRTIMQVKVAAAVSDPNDPALGFNLPELENAFKHKADRSGVFESGQHPIIVGQAAYNSAYGTSFVSGGWCNSPTNPTTRCDGFLRISEQGGDLFKFDTLTKADVFGNPKQVAVKIEPKAIHDETNASAFDEFGRMQANLGLEVVPATPMLQNVVLHPYVFPTTEMVDTSKLPAAAKLVGGAYDDVIVTPISVGDDGTQIWKFTHNGVDTHPIHFHAYDVQTLNRVSWDNVVMPPDATELGWKDTLRISPLMDTIVALRPVVPQLPWDVPNSIRLLNPAMTDQTPLILSSMQDQLNMGLTAFAPNGEPIDVYNHFVNFGAEYVYHCHILSHEEMDMMRPVTLAYPPVAPSNLVVLAPVDPPGNGTRDRYVDLSWTDNSRSETNWVIERATSYAGPWSVLAVIDSDPLNPGLRETTGESIGGTIDYRDVIGTTANAYAYRVQAINVVGDTWNYANPALNNIVSGGFPTITTRSAFTNIASWVPQPAAPTLLTATAVRQGSNNRVALDWTDVPGATGYVIQRARDAAFTQNVTIINRPPISAYVDTVPRLPLGTAYYYRVMTLNPMASPWSNVLSITTQ